MDPELAAIAAKFPRLDAGTSGPAAARAAARAHTGGALRPARETAAVRIRDRSTPGPPGAPDVRVRVYEPSDRHGPAPGLVYFHGGGFVAGDLDSEHPRCVLWAEGAHCVLVSVAYRLAPEHPFPAAVEDGYAVLEWVAAEAPELGVDPARVGVGGGSAGGTLAAAVALMARDRAGPGVAFQVLLYPVLDDRLQTDSSRFVDTPLLDGRATALVWNYYLGEDRSDVSPYAAPARAADLSGLPPTYLMTSELDPLRDEGIEYACRLLQAGVSAELHQFSGAFHGFDLLPAAISQRAVEEQIQWLRAVTRRGSE